MMGFFLLAMYTDKMEDHKLYFMLCRGHLKQATQSMVTIIAEICACTRLLIPAVIIEE